MRSAFGVIGLAILAIVACQSERTDALARPARSVGDAIPAPLTGSRGDPSAGAVQFASRDGGHCVLCHAIAGLDAGFQGNLGPDLTSIGARLSPGQIRYRIVDAQQIWPDTVMPSYYRVSGLRQVGRAYEGKPALSAQQIEDLVAYLSLQVD